MNFCRLIECVLQFDRVRMLRSRILNEWSKVRTKFPKLISATLAIALGAMLAFNAPAIAASAKVTVGDKTFDPGSTGNSPKISLANFKTDADYIVIVSVSEGGIYLTNSAATNVEVLFGFPTDPTVPESEIGFQGSYVDVKKALTTMLFDAPDVEGDVTFAIDFVETELIPNFYYNRGDGHYYLAVDNEGEVQDEALGDQISWDEAKTAANALEKFGMQGYLATLTSEDENDFIAEYTDAQDVWIGAARVDGDNSDCTVGKVWEWADGPEEGTDFFTQTTPGSGGGTPIGTEFNAWAEGEPNSNCNLASDPNWDEGYAVTNWNGDPGEWNDVKKNHAVYAYLVEFSGESTALQYQDEVTFVIIASDGLPETGAPVALGLLFGALASVSIGAVALRRRTN